MFLDDGKKRAGFLVTSTTTTEGKTMKKILGILAVVLLVCGTAIARPQKADTTGPQSLAEAQGSEIGVQVRDTADCDISLIFSNIALFMGENETTQPMPGAVLDSDISILFKQATFAFIHTEEGTEVDQLPRGPRAFAFIHGPRTVLHC
jgi:hypothetical protein